MVQQTALHTLPCRAALPYLKPSLAAITDTTVPCNQQKDDNPSYLLRKEMTICPELQLSEQVIDLKNIPALR
jgi:hypothetical protein